MEGKERIWKEIKEIQKKMKGNGRKSKENKQEMKGNARIWKEMKGFEKNAASPTFQMTKTKRSNK